MHLRSLVSSISLVLLGVTASAAGAQVGHDPLRSPFRDIEGRHEFTLFGGVLQSERDPARVAPQSGTLVGFRYDAHITGPLRLFTGIGRSFQEREIVDPTKPAATQRVGTQGAGLYLLQGGMDLSLTGQRTWHGFAPSVTAAIGLVSDFQKRDTGGFRIGTPFALSLGGGVRWVPGGRYAMRLDVVDHLYRINYPETYSTPPSGGTAVIGTRDKRSNWLHNVGITLGLTYRLVR